MKNKKGFIYIVLVFSIVIGIIIYPTIYRYDVVSEGQNESLFKINRLTGKVYKLNKINLKWENEQIVLQSEIIKKTDELINYIETKDIQLERVKNIGRNIDQVEMREVLNEMEFLEFRNLGLSKEKYIELYIDKLESEINKSKKELEKLQQKDN